MFADDDLTDDAFLSGRLRLFQPHLPMRFARHWAGEWKRLANELGDARNWDVFATEWLPGLLAELPTDSTSTDQMDALLASPWKNEPSIATTAPPTRPRSRTSSTKRRFAAFSAAQFSLRKLAIVR